MAIKIARRLENGWTEYLPNEQDYNCDWCGAKLWVAPDGKSLYCDAVHAQKTNIPVKVQVKEHRIHVSVV